MNTLAGLRNMGNNYMKFVCVGIDVRQWPWSGELNVDETGWDQNEEGYALLKKEFDLQENEYQLLRVQTQQRLIEVSNFIAKRDDCNLVAIEFPVELVKLQDERYGYDTASTKLDLSDFTCRGYDVCDLDGLFSALHNPNLGRRSSRLIPELKLLLALELAQLANALDPGHCPSVVAKVYTLK